MKKNLVEKPASQDEIALYCFIGEALCKIQNVEQAVSHSITLKTHSTANKEEADNALNKHQSYTLGKAIKLVQEQQLYPISLQEDLNSFLKVRNWLVHKAIFEFRDGLYIDSKRNKLFQKIKMISSDAYNIQHTIELDMVNFCTSKGREMSKVLAIINERYSEGE